MERLHMKENKAFQCIGEMPLFDKLLNDVLLLTEEDWTEYGDRKKTRGAASANTDTIPLIYDLKHRIDSMVLHKNYERFSAYVDVVVMAAREHCGQVKAQQAMLTKLKAGAVIPTHRDEGPLTAKTHRIHIPITTNSQCLFTVGGESKNLKPGQIWIVDNVGRLHGVQNNGTEDRVHLIVDAV
jgi:quercetin dioxygenase-like cupin family protein